MAVLDTRPKYGKDMFFQQFGKLVTYFRGNLDKSVTVQYFNRVNPYPLGALEFAVSTWIETHRPTPGNLPTPNELAALCATWLNDHPEIKFHYTRYDDVEDHEYPIGKLFEATKILLDGKEGAFKSFIKVNRMPSNDVERVRNKVNAILTNNPGIDISEVIAGIG